MGSLEQGHATREGALAGQLQNVQHEVPTPCARAGVVCACGVAFLCTSLG